MTTIYYPSPVHFCGCVDCWLTVGKIAERCKERSDVEFVLPAYVERPKREHGR